MDISNLSGRQKAAILMVSLGSEISAKVMKEFEPDLLEELAFEVASLFEGMDPRVVVSQASWWYPEEPGPEHGLWKSNVNVLTRNGPPYDPAMGSVTFRALLCKIYKVEDE